MVVRSYSLDMVLGMCVQCDFDFGDMTLGQGCDTPLGHGQCVSEILSRSNSVVRSHGPDTHFGYMCTVTLTLEIWPSVKIMTDTLLCHGHQLYEMLSRSNMAVRSYGPDTEFGYVCTVNLTLEIWPWVKVMTHPWVMDNPFVKFYPDPTGQWGVMARTKISGMCVLGPWH